MVFTAVAYIFNNLAYPNEYLTFIPFAISIFIFGFAASHLLKLVIKKTGVLSKRFGTQVISLSAMAILFSVIGTFIWMAVMIRAGYWQIEGETAAELRSDFFHEYFFNLFPVLLTMSGWTLIYFLYHYVKGVRREEQLKISYQLQTTELEAKALRAQMNPHFVFNCLNSIKSLMQENQMDKGVQYLTTFSKLIRTLFNNADKKEISLYDEIETCKLYLQLESMRFDSKFSYAVNVEEHLDLKSVQVPALIIQPFIENAIWHGIVPKNGGGAIILSAEQKNQSICVTIDDDGIGIEASMQHKSALELTHQSKGIHLTQSRLQLNNLLKQMTAQLQIVDKKDNMGRASGTKVILSLDQSSL
jgi:sensor histidine kinase YesM